MSAVVDPDLCPFDMLSGGDASKLSAVKRRNRQMIRENVKALRSLAQQVISTSCAPESRERLARLVEHLDSHEDLMRLYLDTIRIRFKWRHSDFHLYQPSSNP